MKRIVVIANKCKRMIAFVASVTSMLLIGQSWARIVCMNFIIAVAELIHFDRNTIIMDLNHNSGEADVIFANLLFRHGIFPIIYINCTCDHRDTTCADFKHMLKKSQFNASKVQFDGADSVILVMVNENKSDVDSSFARCECCSRNCCVYVIE